MLVKCANPYHKCKPSDQIRETLHQMITNDGQMREPLPQMLITAGPIREIDHNYKPMPVRCVTLTINVDQRWSNAQILTTNVNQ